MVEAGSPRRALLPYGGIYNRGIACAGCGCERAAAGILGRCWRGLGAFLVQD